MYCCGAPDAVACQFETAASGRVLPLEDGREDCVHDFHVGLAVRVRHRLKAAGTEVNHIVRALGDIAELVGPLNRNTARQGRGAGSAIPQGMQDWMRATRVWRNVPSVPLPRPGRPDPAHSQNPVACALNSVAACRTRPSVSQA